jgi:hypothetical protein
MVHGAINLPKGYMLAYVPSDAKIALPENQGAEYEGPMQVEISSNYSVTKAGVAIAQTVNAALTLYKSRGDQITHYGYAAFGLTVIPYIIMSVLNLLAQAVTPDFPTFYLVHSAEMEEAQRRGGVFDGVVGSLISADIGDSLSVNNDRSTWIVKKTVVDNVYRLNRSADSTADSPDIVELDMRPDDQFTNSERENRKKREPMPIPSCSTFERQHKWRTPHLHWRAADIERHNVKSSFWV